MTTDESERVHDFDTIHLNHGLVIMTINFRQQARDSLARAQQALKTGDPEFLKYAALELRMAMESITYERAKTYSAEIPPDEYATWQPRKILQLLLEIDPKADKDSSLSYAIEEEFGKPGKNVIGLGTEKVLSLATIKKHYDALGSFLHVPTLKQQKEAAPPDLGKLRQRCELIVEEIEATLVSPIWNINFGNFAEIACGRCSALIRKRLPGDGSSVIAKCFQCGASYDVVEEDAGKVRWIPQEQELNCLVPACVGRFVIWDSDVEEGAKVRCPTCSALHFVRLYLTLEA